MAHLVSPWELKWHCVGAAEHFIHTKEAMKIIITPCLAMGSIWVVRSPSELISLLFRTFIYTPLRSRGRVWGVVYPLPEVCFWGGGRLVRGCAEEKAVAWHRLLFLSGDCHSPLHWAWPWKTIEILTHPGMTKRGGEESWRARRSKKLTRDSMLNKYGQHELPIKDNSPAFWKKV